MNLPATPETKIISLSLETFCAVYSPEPDPWFKQDFDLYSEVKLVLSHPIIQLAFENGGYAAGGFLRHALARRLPILNKTHANAREKLFAHSEADIDIFFRTVPGHVRFLDEARFRCAPETLPIGEVYNELTGCEIPQITEVNANNIDIKFKWFLNGEIQGVVKKRIQAVRSFIGEPEKVLEKFDIINSMIATDGKTVWFNPDIMELEENKLLSLSKNQNLNKRLAVRVQKYVIEHEYTAFNSANDSLFVFANWCQRNLQQSAMNKTTGDELMGWITEQSALVNLFRTDFIKNEDLMLFFNLVQMPMVEKTEDFKGMYQEIEDYTSIGYADAVGATIAYRAMFAVKGRHPPFTKNEFLNANIGFGYPQP